MDRDLVQYRQQMYSLDKPARAKVVVDPGQLEEILFNRLLYEDSKTEN